ncbi:MAG: hypothetical protein ACI9Z3_001692, partial [Roseivirga sp.]
HTLGSIILLGNHEISSGARPVSITKKKIVISRVDFKSTLEIFCFLFA